MKLKITAVVIVALVLISFFAKGNRTNPPVVRNIEWSSQQAKQLFDRACADCHSNETKWPWYSNFAPVSWTLIDHVEHGRGHFNVSANDIGDIDKAAKMIAKGKMPISSYLTMHSEAKLTDQEKKTLENALNELAAKFPSEHDD